jgi:hypothetical protein
MVSTRDERAHAETPPFGWALIAFANLG